MRIILPGTGTPVLEPKRQASALDPAMWQRAAEVGQRIRAEDGVGAAIELIEQYLDPPRKTST